MKVKNTLSAPLLLVFIFALMLLMRFADLSALGAQGNIFLSIIVLQLFVFALPGIIYCKLRGANLKEKLKLGLFAPGKIFFVILSFLALMSGTLLIKLAMYYIFGMSSGGYSVSVYDSYVVGGELNIFYIIAAIAIVPAITEEFIFRGVMLSEYSENGSFCAAVISSAMFAMIHFNLMQFPVYFYAGIMFSITAMVSRSVFASIIVHILNNLFSIFLDGYIQGLIEKPDNLVFLIFILVAVLLVSLYFMFGSAERIYYISGVNNEKTVDLAEGERRGLKGLAEAIFSPAFLLCIALYVAAALV